MTYVTFDPENGDLSLQLPEAYLAYQDELTVRLTEVFIDQELTESVLNRMNEFVSDWLRQQPPMP